MRGIHIELFFKRVLIRGGMASVPRIFVHLGPSWYSPHEWCLQAAFGVRPGRLNDGDAFYRWWIDVPLIWPVQFLRYPNVNPSRAWTGRTHEVYAVQWGLGYARRIKHLGIRP